MSTLVLVIGWLVAVMGAVFLASPSALGRWADFWLNPAGVTFGLALRLVLGVLFVVFADATTAPNVVRAFGVLMLVVALVGFFAGVGRVEALSRRLIGGAPSRARAWGATAVVMGLLLVWAA